MSTLDTAIGLATIIHFDQVDKAGEPYILHILRVVAGVDGIEAKTVAALHDALEDSRWTVRDLQGYGIPAGIIEAVVAITHRKGEPYSDYLQRVIANPLALQVKRSDLLDNTDGNRLAKLPTETRDRLIAKYTPALDTIFDAKAAGIPVREG